MEKWGLCRYSLRVRGAQRCAWALPNPQDRARSAVRQCSHTQMSPFFFHTQEGWGWDGASGGGGMALPSQGLHPLTTSGERPRDEERNWQTWGDGSVQRI